MGSLKFDHKTGEWVGVSGGIDVQRIGEDRKEERKVVATPTSIRAKIEAHPVYGYADRLARRIDREYGNDTYIYWRNVSRSRASGDFVKLGYQSISASFERGFREYKNVEGVWYANGYWPQGQDGQKGVWMEVLHEYAHVLQLREDPRAIAHGSLYQEKLEELITLFPYNECQ